MVETLGRSVCREGPRFLSRDPPPDPRRPLARQQCVGVIQFSILNCDPFFLSRHRRQERSDEVDQRKGDEGGGEDLVMFLKKGCELVEDVVHLAICRRFMN